jgi:predicted amidohydrolase YtcJ
VAGLEMKADLVLRNANVLTMNPAQPRARAIAIKGEKIVRVGSNTEIEPWIGKNTEVVALDGKTVLPGLIDTHIHVADFGKVLMWLDLEGTKSIADLKNLVRERAEKLPQSKWILGRGWNQACFEEKRLPTKADLDEAAPKNPVLLYHQTEQMCVVNRIASTLAGVTNSTGILRGDATSSVWSKVPELTQQELLDAIRMALQKILEAGVTSINWIVLSQNEIPIIKKLCTERLQVRIYLIVPANLVDAAIDAGLTQVSGGMVKLGGALIFTDGYLASRTAALLEPYSDASDETGKLLCSAKEIVALAEKMWNFDFQLVIHCVGDKAVDAALSAIEASGSGKGRVRLEQAAVLNSELITRMKKQQVLISVQPKVIDTEFSVWSAVKRLGSERARLLFPTRTLLDNGLKVLGGSDCPMEPLNPLLGVQTAVKRKVPYEQSVSVEEALRMYTVDAAYGSFEENLKGSIEEGKLADFTILSEDLHSISPNKISEIITEKVILDGQVVYSKAI